MSTDGLVIESMPRTEWQTQENWVTDFLKSGAIFSVEPGWYWVGIGEAQRSNSYSVDRLSVYAPDFFLEDPRPWFQFERWMQVSASDLTTALPPHASLADTISWEQPREDEFRVVFEDLQSKISRGVLAKGVPFTRRTAQHSFETWDRAKTIVHATEVASEFPMTVYGVWNSEEGMLGATPELLFEIFADGHGHRKMRTMALAGTRSKRRPSSLEVESPHASLLTDPKERFEHQVVVDGIVSRLAEFGEVAVGETAEVVLPTLIHLKSVIEVAPDRPTEFQDWVVALHPTPAIGAWPRAEGWDWLKSQQRFGSRHRFGAPFGLVPPEDGAATRSPESAAGKCVVAIRNVQWSGNEVQLMAGCGVVGLSRLDREWHELHSKLDAVQEALGV